MGPQNPYLGGGQAQVARPYLGGGYSRPGYHGGGGGSGGGHYYPQGNGLGYPGYNQQRPYGGHQRPSYYQHQHQYNHNPFDSWFAGGDFPGSSLAKPHINLPLVPSFSGVLGTRTDNNMTVS